MPYFGLISVCTNFLISLYLLLFLTFKHIFFIYHNSGELLNIIVQHALWGAGAVDACSARLALQVCPSVRVHKCLSICLCTHTNPNTHTNELSLTRTHTHTNTHSLQLTLSISHTHSHKPTLSLTLSHTHSLTHPPTGSPDPGPVSRKVYEVRGRGIRSSSQLENIPQVSLSLSHSFCLSHTHSLSTSLFLSQSLSLSHTHTVSLSILSFVLFSISILRPTSITLHSHLISPALHQSL